MVRRRTIAKIAACYITLHLVTVLSARFVRKLTLGHTSRHQGRTAPLVIVTQSEGLNGFDVIRQALHGAFPKLEIFVHTSDDYQVEKHGQYDVIVEGPPTFQGADKMPCRFSKGPWIQFSGEAIANYDDKKWCKHDEVPILRFDTSMHSRSIMHDSQTLHVWAPYACSYIISSHEKYINRTVDFNSFQRRPYFLAWASSNCVGFRTALWRALRTVAKSRQVGEVHSMGMCEHDYDANQTGFWLNDRVYSNYKFVFVAENTIERGYVSEKLATVLASGAIPIYLGDSSGAEQIFAENSFIDVNALLAGVSNRTVPPTSKTWDTVAKEIFDIALNETAVLNLLLKDVLRRPHPTKHAHAYYSPPFPSSCLHSVDASTDVHHEVYSTLCETVGPCIKTI